MRDMTSASWSWLRPSLLPRWRSPACEVLEAPRCGPMRGPARIIVNGIPMEQFATILTNTLGERLVIDKTGLMGRFAFHLAFTPEKIPGQAPPPGVPPIDPNGPTFFTALQEQLGLKIQSGRVPLKVVIIDNIERPTPD